jgi:hypothetical protein
MIFQSNQYDTLIQNNHHWYEYDKNITLDDIKKFMKEYHSRRKQQVCIHELGVGKYRFDFVSVNPYQHRIRILEYKVSRADFNGDRKHLEYMQYCNTLAFVTPLGLVNINDLKDPSIGLLQVFKWKKRQSEINRWYLGAIWLRKPRGKPLDEKIYYRVADMLLARVVQGRKEDFF